VSDRPVLDDLMAVLGHRFAAPELLERALSHSSASGDRAAPMSYERLEFLGDRVLSLVVAEMLFRRFEHEREGLLARRLAAMVDRDSLVAVARAIGLGRFIKMSVGEAQAGTGDQPTVLADACEAVIGALYLDGGLPAAARFIEDQWAPQITPTPPRDPKTALQEWAQAQRRKLPHYRVVAVSGPPHNPLFTVEARVEPLPPVTAQGGSKRAAEQAAAHQLLELIERQAENGG
jgi:ribonuclease-3